MIIDLLLMHYYAIYQRLTMMFANLFLLCLLIHYSDVY
jgi:hypothetical protein